MATSPIKVLTTGQRMQGGQLIFKEHGKKKWNKIGPVGAVTFTPTLTEVTSRSDETGQSQLIGSWVTQSDAVLNIADIQMRTETLEEALMLATTKYRTQTAVASAVLTVEDVEVGDVIDIPGMFATIISVEDTASGSPHVYHEDATGFGSNHYIFQSERNVLEFIAKPTGAAADADITYSLPAVTEADGIIERTMLTTSGKRGELRVLGSVGANGALPGVAEDYIFLDVELRGDGAVTLKGVDNLNTGTLTAKVYNTGGAGYGFSRPVQSLD